MSKWEYTETELWRFGEHDIAIYHVFASLAVKNTVLVFAEARYSDGSDAGAPHDIVMRKSTDGGKSFGESVCLVDGKRAHCYVNPTPIYDAQTGRVHLAFAENFGNKQTVLYLMHSDDGGESWSVPREITHLITQKTDTRFHLPGPGHGIQMEKAPHKGRLLLPVWHRIGDVKIPRAERGYCTSFLYSDDHGETWRDVPPIGHAFFTNESRLCETNEGLVWTLRSFGTQYAISYSRDGGAHWSEPQVMPIAPACFCDSGMTSLRGKGNYDDTVLFSHISNTDPHVRCNMEICISTDGGKTFPKQFALPAGDAMPGYSDLCVIEEDEPIVGLVHCRCNHVLFSRISMQTLTGGEYDGTGRSVWKRLG